MAFTQVTKPNIKNSPPIIRMERKVSRFVRVLTSTAVVVVGMGVVLFIPGFYRYSQAHNAVTSEKNCINY
jgi:hypothetical protein